MQASFSDLEYDAKKRLTRRDRFLAEIEAVTPWTLLVAELEPFYPKGEGRGRPPIGLEKMLPKGLMMRGGTVVDATIIAAPSSTKNRDRARDPEMHQTKKGNEWHFGMKAHIGVDAESGLTHTLVTTPANTADVTVADQLLHGEETLAFGDAGYRGVEKRAAAKQKRPHWHVAMRPGKRRALPDTPLGRILEKIEYYKASVRAKVEHPFHIIKNLLGLKKVRYRGLAKNTARLYTLFGLANLMIAGRQLGMKHSRIAS
ncbi:MAG: IS5 family transposase [Betaproteobacteria bacterium]|nr:IS5 family transposase [Betaproteobacteria bacterium]